ncbi:acyltransferase family protein, partial [Klebsiella pneumoniae]|uniref:acyltransferase family protein n=1 Tax=Klebsiella pneumoniae TaxID=573 RepID=UPI0013B06007
MRETWVDYAKGIGIILVVFGHANRGLYSSGIYISPEIYHYLDNVIYSFHMPLFFFLSGGNDSNLLIVFYVQIVPDDFVMQ